MFIIFIIAGVIGVVVCMAFIARIANEISGCDDD